MAVNNVRPAFYAIITVVKWASSWDYGTYHIGNQRRLRRACASTQSRQSLHCSHTWSMEVDEGADENIRHVAPLDGCTCAVWRMSLRRTKSTIISWLGSNCLCRHVDSCNFFYNPQLQVCNNNKEKEWMSKDCKFIKSKASCSIFLWLNCEVLLRIQNCCCLFYIWDCFNFCGCTALCFIQLFFCLILYAFVLLTLMIPSFRTDMSGQTVQTQVRLFL